MTDEGTGTPTCSRERERRRLKLPVPKTYPKAMPPLICPDCGAEMVLRDSKYGLFYGCSTYPKCKASHGAHPDGRPLGTPATAEVKQARIRAHAAFDRLWKEQPRRMKRTEAYRWMQERLGLSSDEAHIGKFDKEQCAKLIEAVEKYLKENP